MKYEIKDKTFKISPSVETRLAASTRGDRGPDRSQSGNIPITMIPDPSATCK
jgi:hypothetical protein